MAWNATASRAPKVGICVPVKDKPAIEWSFQFSQMTAMAGVELALYSSKHYELDYARNDLVDQSIREGCTHTFFLDTDVVPWYWELAQTEPNGPVKLLHRPFPEVIRQFLAFEYPIVSGLYWVKRPPGGSNMALVVDAEDFRVQPVEAPLVNLVGRCILVDMVGMGCCLIDNRVFDKIPYPWFSYYRSKERGPDGRFPELSEDFYFGRKARAAGFPIVAAGNVICKHGGEVWFNWGGDANGVLMA